MVRCIETKNVSSISFNNKPSLLQIKLEKKWENNYIWKSNMKNILSFRFCDLKRCIQFHHDYGQIKLPFLVWGRVYFIKRKIAYKPGL